ncbi:adhesin [Mesomycoplasma hyorhinis]|uniref:adhesin n=2 Tax=Mesomycoplasma hyorhinis TaxID=2100 RepID=UPI0021FC4C69|nr:adhesin [Mesomycoplasma hyorhinis]
MNNKSFKKKALAIVSLAIAGASLGTVFLIPYLIKNWKGIQYKVIDLKQNFDNLTTDKSVDFSFELPDQDAYELNYADLNVHLFNEQGQQVLTSLAKYDYFARKYRYVQPQDQTQLQAGSKYYIQVETQNNFYKHRKVKKTLAFAQHSQNYVLTKASVKEIKFNVISNKEAGLEVNFNDSIKSLENKRVALQYHYININNNEDDTTSNSNQTQAKNLSQESITSYIDSATVSNQKALFFIKNLTPNRKYVIESVKIIDQVAPDSFVSKKVENIYNHLSEEQRSFQTNKNTVWVNNISTHQIDDYSKSLILSFDENDDNKTSLEGKRVKLQYSRVDDTSTNPKLFTLDSVITSKIAEFKLDGSNSQNILEPGSKYRIQKVFVADAFVDKNNPTQGIEFKLDDKQRYFESTTQITNIEFDQVSTNSANINVTFASALDPALIENQEASLTLSPISGKKITGFVKKDSTKTNIYTISFHATDLFQKTEYFVDSVKLLLKNNQVVYFDDSNVAQTQDSSTANINVKKLLFDKTLETTKDASKRSFRTTEVDVAVFIKSFPETKTNSVEYNIGFTPLFAWLNGHEFILKYKQLNYTGPADPTAKDGFGPIISSRPAKAQDYNIKFSLIQFNNGLKYQLDSIHLVDDPSRKIELNFDPVSKQNDLSSNQFATKFFVQKIEINHLDDTSATVKLIFGDYTKSLLKEQLQNHNTRNVKLLYESQDPTIISNDFADAQVKEENGEVVAEFHLTNLQKKTTYALKNVYLDSILANFTDSTLAELPNNTFTTLHKKVIISTAKVNDIMSNTASVDVSFDLGSNLFLINKKLKLIYQKESDGSFIESEATHVGLGLNTSFKLKDLEAGTKYKLVDIKVDPSQTDITDTKFEFKTNDANTQTEFYTYLGVLSFKKENLAQEQIDISVALENSDPKTANIQDATLVYQRLSDQTIFTQKQKSYDQTNKTLKFELRNLTKFTDYKIVDVVYNFQNLVWNKKINKETDESIKWKTLAQDAKIINIYQNIKELHKIGISLNFDNFKDAYLQQDKIKIKLKKTQPDSNVANNSATLEKEVQVSQDLTADFIFDNLDSGSTYQIESITDTQKPDLKLQDWNNKSFYTQSEIKSFEFSEVQQNSAKVKINFADSEGFYNNKKIQVFYKQVRTGNVFSVTSQSQVSNHEITINLNNLDKYSEYVIENVFLVSDSGNTSINISDTAKTNSAFATTISEINLVDVKVDKITTTSAHVSVIFDSNIDFYLDNKQVKIVFAAKNQNTDHNWTITKDVTITNKNGIYQADTDLENLEEGAQFEIKSFEVGIEKITPTSNLKPVTLDDTQNVMHPVFKLNNKEWTQNNIAHITAANFATLGVISTIATTNITENSATISVNFKNLNTDPAQVFNNHVAVLSFDGPEGRISAKTQTNISNNVATFTFNHLEKQTKYSNPTLIIQNVNNPQREITIPLSKEYDTLNQGQTTKTNHIKEFTTSWTSVSITSFEYEKLSTTSNQLTFEFDRLVDYLIDTKKVKLYYKQIGTNNQDQSEKSTQAQQVSDSTVSFNLNDLAEGSKYEVVRLEVDDAAGHTTNISVNTNQVFTTQNANKKYFYTQSVISSVNKSNNYGTTDVNADTKARFSITLNDMEGRFNSTAEHPLKDVTRLELTSQHSNNIIEVKPTSFSNNTLEFNLDNLDKLSEYHINNLFINNEVIPWAHDLTQTTTKLLNQRVFNTTANQAKLVSVTQTDSSAHKAVVNIQFDSQKDYFLLGNSISVKFKKTSGTPSQNPYVTKQVTIDNEGVASVEIDQQSLATNPTNQNLTAGAVYKIESIDFHNTKVADANKLANTKITLDVYKQNSSDVAASTPLSSDDSEFRTQPIVETLQAERLENSTGQINIQINSEDTKLTTKYAWITYQSQKDNSIKTLKSANHIANSNGQYKANFDLRSLNVLERYKVLSVKLGDDNQADAKANDLELNQQIDQQNHRDFYTKPTIATIQDIQVDYPDARGTTAVVDIKFDNIHDAYLNGSSAKITYERIAEDGRQIGQDITHIQTLSQKNFQIINSSVKFTLTGDTTNTSDTQKVVLVKSQIDQQQQIQRTNTVKSIGTQKIEKNEYASQNQLVEGTRYRIKKIELVNPSDDLKQLHFQFKQSQVPDKKINETRLIEPLRISTYDYKIQVDETPTAVNTTIATYYSTSYNLQDSDKNKFNLYVKNLSTNEVEIVSSAKSITNLNPTDNDGNYKVEFVLINKKASIYKILSTTYDNQNIIMSSYINPETSKANVYTTPASKSKVKELKYLANSQLKETQATVTAYFDDTNEDLTRVKRKAKLFYKKVGAISTSASQLLESAEVEIKENKAEFKLGQTNQPLTVNTQYVVEKIEINSKSDFQNEIQANKLDTNKFNIIAQKNDSTFDVKIQNNDKLFETKAQFETSYTNKEENSATVTLSFKNPGHQIQDNKIAYIVFAESTLAQTNQNDIFQVAASRTHLSNANVNQNILTFNLRGLKKGTQYKVKKVIIDNIEYNIEQNSTATFSTILTKATVTNIVYNYSDFATTEANLQNNTDNNVKAKFRIYFQTIDNFLNNQYINVKLNSKKNALSEQTQTSSAINKVVQVHVDKAQQNSGLVYADVELTNSDQIKAATEYSIEQIQVLNSNASQDVKQGVTVEGLTNNGNITKDFYTITNIESFNATVDETSAELTFKLNSYDPQLINEPVVLVLSDNNNQKYYSQVVPNPQNPGQIKFYLSHLDKLKSYTIESLQFSKGASGVNIAFKPNVSKTFKTIAKDFEIKDIMQVSNTANSVKLKLTFNGELDKYLDTKQIKLKYKEYKDGVEGLQKISKTIATIKPPTTVTQTAPNTFEAEFDLQELDVVSGTRYKIEGVELVDSSIQNDQQQPLQSRISDDIAKFFSNKLLFETKVAQPKLKSIELLQTTNEQGEENTYIAPVKLVFYDKNDALAKDKIGLLSNGAVSNNDSNAWNFEFWTDQKKSNVKFLDNVEIEHNSVEKTTTVKVFMQGNAKDWVTLNSTIESQNSNQKTKNKRIRFKYSYYEDLDRKAAMSVGNLNSDVIHTYADANSNSAQNNDPLYVDSPDWFVLEKTTGTFLPDAKMIYSFEVYDPNNKINTLQEELHPEQSPTWKRRELYNTMTENIEYGNQIAWQTINKIQLELKSKQSILNFRNLTYSEGNNREFDVNAQYSDISATDAEDIPNYTNSLNNNSKINFRYKYPSQDSEYKPSNIDNSQSRYTQQQKNTRINTYVREIKATGAQQNSKIINLQVGSGTDSLNLRQKVLSKILSINFDNLSIKDKPVLFAKNSSKFINTIQTPFSITNNAWWFGAINDPNSNSNILGLTSNIDLNTNVDQNKFGIKNIRYNNDTNSVTVDYQRNTDAQIQTAFPEAVYASFINQKGDLYFFGGKDGNPLSYRNDYDFTNNTMTFYLGSEQIPYNQRPKFGEILSFVGVVVAPYLGDGTPTNRYSITNRSITLTEQDSSSSTIDFSNMYLTNFVKQEPIYKRIKIGSSNFN